MTLHSLPVWFWLALGGLSAAFLLLGQAQRADERNWVVERATPMSIGLVNPRDDVWLEGDVECAQPLRVPHFEKSCVHYSYREEERVERTRMVNGRPLRYQTWETRHQEDRRVDFDLVQRDARITVRSQTAQFDAAFTCGPEEYAYNWRRSAGYFPCPAKAGAIGSVSDDRRGLESYGNIPLLVTLRRRDEFIAGLERTEGRLRWGGGAMLFAGLFGLLVTLSTVLNFPPAGGAESRHIALGLAGAVVLFLAWLAAYLYNRLVMYRERVKTAWRHIDVDLKNRYDLVPELVEVIKGYKEHERELFSTLARIGASRAEGEIATGTAQAIAPLPDLGAVSERYPELKASQLFTQLQNQLTAMEEKIACARRFYNDNVLAYNNARSRFPTSVIARVFPRFPVYEPFVVPETSGP